MDAMGHERASNEGPEIRVDAEVGKRLIEVRRGVTAVRHLRASLVQLAYATAARPGYEGILLLPDAAVTRERLRHEWQLAASVFRPETTERLSLVLGEHAPFQGIPRDPDPETAQVLEGVLARAQAPAGVRRTRGDAQFVVLKVLFHHWLTSAEPVTAQWLMRRSGYTYPTVAGVLEKLGSLVERTSDRRLRIRWFSREELLRLTALSDASRAAARFVDRSGRPRSPEAHLRRLEKLAPGGVGVGGVLGALHYFPELDLAAPPRLDLSRHGAAHSDDFGFIHDLDPALERVEDPLAPATVVVHAIRHAESLFEPREGGLAWADPVECLLDLHEARLDAQAAQFFEALQRGRPKSR